MQIADKVTGLNEAGEFLRTFSASDTFRLMRASLAHPIGGGRKVKRIMLKPNWREGMVDFAAELRRR